MPRIEVRDTAVITRSGDGKNGKRYSIREQSAWLHQGKPYPSEVKIRLGDEQAAFAMGDYLLTDACFWIDRWGKVNCDLAHMQLKPVAAAARTA